MDTFTLVKALTLFFKSTLTDFTCYSEKSGIGFGVALNLSMIFRYLF